MLSVANPFVPCTSTFVESNDNQPLITFDDILDIAREFEFASTFTCITESEETKPVSIEYLSATMFSIEKPASISRLSFDHEHERCEWQLSAPQSPDSTASTSSDVSESRHSSPVLEDHVRIKVEDAVSTMLLGWSPPDGSPFIELDEDLLCPKTVQDKPYPAWLTKILTPSSNSQPQPTSSTSPAPNSDDEHSHKPTTSSQAPATHATCEQADNLQVKKTLPSAAAKDPIPALCPALPAIKTGPSSQAAPTKFFITPEGKPLLKLRLHPLSVSVPVPRKHASAPRGGVPPHIARTVTKANILRAEKERKMAKAPSKGEGKKPSVLRITKKEKRVLNGGGGGKKLLVWDDEEWEPEGGKAAKRTRVCVT